MYVLDTNVASELVRTDGASAPQVISWISSRKRSDMYLTAVNQAELLYGVAIMPTGRRRLILQAVIDKWLADGFKGRILPFDDVAAQMYAKIAATRRSLGRPIAVADCQIAAITRAKDATLVTRNVQDFENTGINVVNPWAES